MDYQVDIRTGSRKPTSNNIRLTQAGHQTNLTWEKASKPIVEEIQVS
jgi:hypothetical protein